MSIGLIAALPAEVRCFTHARPKLNTPFALNPALTGIVCGMGREAAANAAGSLLDLHVEALVSWGTAGALAPDLRSGDLLLPENVLCGGMLLATDKNWLARISHALHAAPLTIHSGQLIETREILTGTASKQELHLRTGAVAADMESAAILETAIAGKIPCIAIRAIVDEARMTIPGALVKHLDRFGRPAPAGLMMEIFHSPRLLTGLCRLGASMRKAMTTLQALVNHTNNTLMYNS